MFFISCFFLRRKLILSKNKYFLFLSSLYPSMLVRCYFYCCLFLDLICLFLFLFCIGFYHNACEGDGVHPREGDGALKQIWKSSRDTCCALPA
ncbi:hypothetical protein I3842_04G035800 [Carya illinoinensis]|uniref:Uncharacterized protein n=1 Tax=Carya illinoinensis TaxID=32201 RepID=A0A922F934_CARIL|nr:hypothetical protein I3842_04G035800 [Carya illinoinensis]